MNLAMSDAFHESSRIPIAESKAWVGSEVVYAAMYRDLLRVAFVLTGSAPAAEDVVHDVFAKIGPRIDSLAEPAAYLRVAVVNRCRSLHRRDVAAPRTRPSRQRDDGHRACRVARCLDSAPIRQRSAIVLRYLCDLPEEEIAAILKCRRSTVRTLVREALPNFER